MAHFSGVHFAGVHYAISHFDTAAFVDAGVVSIQALAVVPDVEGDVLGDAFVEPIQAFATVSAMATVIHQATASIQGLSSASVDENQVGSGGKIWHEVPRQSRRWVDIPVSRVEEE